MGLGAGPKRVDLAEIVYQGEPRTRPLYIHLKFGPDREAVHAVLLECSRKGRGGVS